MSKSFIKVLFLIFSLAALVICTSAQTKKKKIKIKPPPPTLIAVQPPPAMDEKTQKLALDALLRANFAHGGAALNNIKTLRIKGKRRVNDFFYDLHILVDLDSQKVRLETKGVNGYFNVRQIEDNKSWSFFDKAINELEAEERGELESILHAGFLGLRSNSLINISILFFADDKANDQKLITVSIKGREYLWTFDSKNRLISQTGKNQSRKENLLFDDFRIIDGVNIPHKSFLGSLIVEYANNVLTVDEWTSVEVNPSLTAQDWAFPK
jgi:hypothetical protein